MSGQFGGRHYGGVADAGWVVVVPVKAPARAKSRLRGAWPGVAHEDLVVALVRDTLAAAARCAAVAELVVVTGAPLPADIPGVRTLPDPGLGGLNGALRHAADWCAREARDLGRVPPDVAVLLGDLPALDPGELAAALAAATTRAFVADAAGTGTTLLAAPAGTALDPRFGPGSAGAHRDSGALPLAGAWPTLRRDVDTAADLAAAAALGLGRHTGVLHTVAERAGALP
jgi:2-phospho-L-lactate guanylyltransferase